MSKKTKKTKVALLTSIMSIVLCCAMLVGTTFAWFTDEASTAVNTIQAGTLDVDLIDAETKESLEGKTLQFIKADGAPDGQSVLWEPGVTYKLPEFQIVNKGNLALKYNIVINGITDGNAKLLEAIDFTVDIGGSKDLDLKEFEGHLEPNQKSSSVTITGHMKESAGNEYQGLSIDGISITVYANQWTYEYDSEDNQYDADAPKLFYVESNGVKTTYETEEKALAAAEDGNKVYLSSATNAITVDKKIELTIANTNITAGEGKNAITVNADSTIIVEGYNVLVGGKNGDGINVAENVNLKLTGDGNLITKGNNGLEYFSYKDGNGNEYGDVVSNTDDSTYDNQGGSGIDVSKGATLLVDGLKGLTAEGYGEHAFGIGGASKSITIKNSTVNYARGGHAYTKLFIPGWNNHFYGKQEPEGGAGIGSSTDGAIITIDNSVIRMAEGGSKGAGIGACYWTGVTVNIADSDVTAIGGNASAGIGGSRIYSWKNDNYDANNEKIIVNIEKSTINATGGEYGSGIGSGYNTYCAPLASAPEIKVSIDKDSNITAQGGFLAAGIGTGHNVVNFVNEVECDTTNVKAGSSEDDCCDGAAVTTANAVGLGVLKISAFGDMFISTQDALNDAIANGANEITLLEGEYTIPDSAKGKTLTINGSGSDKTIIKVIPCNAPGAEANGQLDYSLDGSTVTFNNVQIKTNSQLYAGYARLSAVYNNCVIQNTYNLGVGTSVFNNCVFNITNEYLRVGGATSAEFNGCTFNTEGRAILVFQDGTNVHQSVTVKDCTFNASAKAYTWNGIHVAAVSIDGTNGTYTVTLTGTNTVGENFTGLHQIKAGEANVTVN